ncbi:MAG: hypothetical protein JWQ36_1935 [Enterovirga sp.]|jgi:hypothetical protein|nr:hypothetical protein [Enterovirga sp.]
MSQNKTHGGHSGHQGMNPDRKDGDEKQRKQSDTDHAKGGSTPRAGEGTEKGTSGRGGA